MVFLDLGCGDKRFAQHTAEVEFDTNRINVVRADKYCKDDIDEPIDVLETPYNFKTNYIDGVLLSHVLEHFQAYDGIRVLEELYRITKPKGKIVVYCPHFSNPAGKAHLTHQRLVGYGTFDNFLPGSLEKYSDKSFNIIEKSFRLGGFWRRVPFLEALFNRFPVLSETYLSNFIPIREVKFVLVPVKEVK
jgi:SAM-dependent methyltransferase